MDTDIERKPKSFLKEKILRFKPIVFIKKNIFVFSLLLILSLTFVLGVWNLSKFGIYELNGKEIEQDVYGEIERYAKENILESNFFLFSPVSSQEDMYDKISKIKSIRIEKVLPDKVVFFVEIYEPKYVANLKSNNCYVLSQEGISLEKICEEQEEGCCLESSTQRNLIFISSSNIDIAVVEGEKSRLLIMKDIERVVKIIETFKYEISSVVFENDILEISEKSGKLFRFIMTDDINIQIRRFVIVISKIKNDTLEFGSLDLRFERPVMKE